MTKQSFSLILVSIINVYFSNSYFQDFLYTQSVEKPTKVYKQLRFIVRVAQLLFSCASFSALAVSTVQINYSYAVLGTSGVNFMCLVSLSSLVYIHTHFKILNFYILVCFLILHGSLSISFLPGSSSPPLLAV